MTEKHLCSFWNKHLLLAVILSAGSSFLKHVTWVLLKHAALCWLSISNTFHNTHFVHFLLFQRPCSLIGLGFFEGEFFSLEGKNCLTKIGGKGTNLNHEWRHIQAKFLLWNENTGSINRKEHIQPQVIIITVTKFRRLAFPSKNSAECYK